MKEQILYRTSSYEPALVNPYKCERCQATQEWIVQEVRGVWRCRRCSSDSLHTRNLTHRSLTIRHHKLDLRYPLTNEQARAASEIKDSLSRGRHVFLHAVTGAGKTEMVFEAILDALNRNERVAFAIPRIEIVLQLYRRLTAAFPYTVIKAIYGQCHDDEDASIVVTTIQQLAHYVAEFDFILIDETDAFPLTIDELLWIWAIRSLTKKGKIVFMSATTHPSLMPRMMSLQMTKISVTRRFHDQNLDLPALLHVVNLEKAIAQRVLPKKVIRCLRKWVDDSHRVFVFVPTKTILPLVLHSIQKEFPNAEGIHASSNDRQSVLKRFDRGDFSVLVTTTLLERGVTFPRLDCLVLFADHPVFSKETLIQISGRVGRSLDTPHGDIVFVASSKTRAMVESIHEIEKWNRP